MRALFEDTVYASTQAECECGYVTEPMNSNRRDVWLRFAAAATGEIVLKAYATRALATTDPAPAGYLASVTITCSDSAQTVTLADNGSTDPDMTGLKVYGTFKSTLAADAVWGYTCAPDLVEADNIRTILRAYVGAGKALSEFGSTADATGGLRIIVGGIPEPPEGPVLPAGDGNTYYLEITTEGPEVNESLGVGSDEYHEFPISLRLFVETFGDDGDEFPAQQAWREAARVMHNIASIVNEERDTYNLGRGRDTVEQEGPDLHPARETLAVATVRYRKHCHIMWRDDQTPRL